MTTASESSKPESVMDSWTGPPSSGTCDAPISDDWPEWWTSSLRDSPASPTASPEDASAPLTNGTSGRTPLEPFATWDRGGCCWRTFQASLLTGMPEPWSGNWPSSAMTALGTAYRLRPLVRHTSVGGGSVYPTPLTTDAQGSSGPPLSQSHATKWDGANSLGRMAQQGLWPTPTVHGNNNRAGLSEKSGDGLQTAVRLWPTPRAGDGRKGPDWNYVAQQRQSPALPTAVRLWPTPVVSDSDRQSAKYGGGNETLLGAVASRWPTPMAHDAKAPGPSAKDRGEPSLSAKLLYPTPVVSQHYQNRSASPGASLRPSLTGMAETDSWPTPAARDAKDSGREPSQWERHTPGLSIQVQPDWPTPGGADSHGQMPEEFRGGRLNPRWVEWLMGIPIGWTSSEPLATGSYRQWWLAFCGEGSATWKENANEVPSRPRDTVPRLGCSRKDARHRNGCLKVTSKKKGVVMVDTYPMPPDGWVCFHCGARFLKPGAARDHFGPTPKSMPACTMSYEHGLMELRKLEERVAALVAQEESPEADEVAG